MVSLFLVIVVVYTFCLPMLLVPVTYAKVPEDLSADSARSKLAVQYSDEAIEERMKGHFSEALELISKSIEISPKDCEFLFIRAQIYAKQKKYRPAINDLNQALADRHPNCPVFAELNNRAAYFLEIGALSKCAKDVSAAIKIAPKE